MRPGALLAGAWDFVVGDDWRTALGIAVALGLTALLAAAGVAAWWLLPVSAMALLRSSLQRRARLAGRSGL